MLFVPLTRQFREEAGCIETPLHQPAPAPLKNILLVGAFSDRSQAYNEAMIGENDRHYLKGFLHLISTLHVPVAPDVKVRPLNIEQGPAHDFLDPANTFKADAVVFCYVFYRPTPPTPQEKQAYTPLNLLSPHSFDPQNWVNAIHKSGASLVANVTEAYHRKTPDEPPLYAFLENTNYLPLCRRMMFECHRGIHMFAHQNLQAVFARHAEIEAQQTPYLLTFTANLPVGHSASGPKARGL